MAETVALIGMGLLGSALAERAPLLASALHRQLLVAGVAAGWSERDNSAIMAVLRALGGDG
jgi:3-hydroxyisobutyrate dehydrogenase-like beta-hydroxyacid dehydrogenase